MPAADAARTLAQDLLQQQACSSDEACIAAAFAEFLAQLRAHDRRACAVEKLLGERYAAPQGTAYFLEVLAAERSPAQRRRRGMYFTPGPVVQYLVAAAAAAFASERVTLVDPACGAGVFLAEAANVLPAAELWGYDLSSAAADAAQALVPQAQVRAINPLLAGEKGLAPLLAAGQPLLVVGNPPYANFGRQNQGAWLGELLRAYRPTVRERKTNVSDDCLKFLRWGEYAITRAKRGCLALVMSRTWLDGLTHCAVRASLSATFDSLHVIDLHGDGALHDENIFGIRRGVCLLVGVRGGTNHSLDKGVRYASLRGTRSAKLAALAAGQAAAAKVVPLPPDYRFTLRGTNTVAAAHQAYATWPALPEIFGRYVSGVQTKGDALFLDFSAAELARRLEIALADPQATHQAWPRRVTKFPAFDPTKIIPCQCAPGDVRWLYYEPLLLGRARGEVMQQMLGGDNLALVFMRQTSGVTRFTHAWATRQMVTDRVFYSRRGAPFLAPLWWSDEQGSRQANLQPAWLERLRTCAGEECPPEDALAYVYACLHEPDYRLRWREELATDFPRIPWPHAAAKFTQLVHVGRQLLALHIRWPEPTAILELHGTGVIERGYPRWDENRCWLGRDSWIEGLTPTTRDFEVGGWRLLERWLKVRRGRTLQTTDLEHLAALDQVARETNRLVAQLTE
jgi:predicted helicase